MQQVACAGEASHRAAREGHLRQRLRRARLRTWGRRIARAQHGHERADACLARKRLVPARDAARNQRGRLGEVRDERRISTRDGRM